MKVNVTNTDAIGAALDEAQRGKSARLIDGHDVSRLANILENHFDKLGIPQNLRKGATVLYSPHSVAKSYGYHADGTAITLLRGGKDWFLTGVTRRVIGSSAPATRIDFADEKAVGAVLMRNASRLP